MHHDLVTGQPRLVDLDRVARSPRRRDLDAHPRGRPDSPQSRGGAMAQHGAGSGREHGGHPAPLAREHPMADRVHAAVPHVQLVRPGLAAQSRRASSRARQAAARLRPRAGGRPAPRSLETAVDPVYRCQLQSPRHAPTLPGQSAQKCCCQWKFSSEIDKKPWSVPGARLVMSGGGSPYVDTGSNSMLAGVPCGWEAGTNGGRPSS